LRVALRAAAPSSLTDFAGAALRAQPLSLTVRDIKADGHCLYRSLEDQLSLENGTRPLARTHARHCATPARLTCRILRSRTPSCRTLLLLLLSRRRAARREGLPVAALCSRGLHAQQPG
jgi:hypothetical protein